jgi:hypothetical protein
MSNAKVSVSGGPDSPGGAGDADGRKRKTPTEADSFPDMSANMSTAWRNSITDQLEKLKDRVAELEMWHLGMGEIAKKNPNLEFQFADLEKKVAAIEAENKKLRARLGDEKDNDDDDDDDAEGPPEKRVKFSGGTKE